MLRSRDSAGSRMEPDAVTWRPQLTDEQWALIADLFTPPRRAPSDPGRPRADVRRCFEGIVWVLRTGARWKDLPRSFPSYVTCWRRFVEWTDEGVWEKAWRRLLKKLDEQGQLNWEEGMADGTFASAKKGVNTLAPPDVARGASLCSSSMEPVCPLA